MNNYDTWLELSESVWLEEDSDLIIMQLDRIALSLEVGEFLDFFNRLSEAKAILLNHPDYVVGKTTVDGVEKDILVPRPGDDEYV